MTIINNAVFMEHANTMAPFLSSLTSLIECQLIIHSTAEVRAARQRILGLILQEIKSRKQATKKIQSEFSCLVCSVLGFLFICCEAATSSTQRLLLILLWNHSC